MPKPHFCLQPPVFSAFFPLHHPHCPLACRTLLPASRLCHPSLPPPPLLRAPLLPCSTRPPPLTSFHGSCRRPPAEVATSRQTFECTFKNCNHHATVFDSVLQAASGFDKETEHVQRGLWLSRAHSRCCCCLLCRFALAALPPPAPPPPGRSTCHGRRCCCAG